MLRVAIVEDDMDQARLFAFWLNNHGYEVTLFVSGELLVEALTKAGQHFDLILMDWVLPGNNGIETMKAVIGSSGSPVVFLTGKKQDHNLAEALNSGADDFISKPVSETVLLARVHAVLRRHGKVHHLTSGLFISRSDCQLCLGEHKQNLTAAELSLMQVFLQNEGILLQRDELAESVWGDVTKAEEGRALDLLISRLRKKLQQFKPVPAKISSRYGQGYVFEKLTE